MHPDYPHPAQPELAQYAARQLPAPDALRVSDHLAGCAVCRQTLTGLASPSRGQPGDFLIEPEDLAPDFEVLADAVDGTLSPAQNESLAATLAVSPTAREALADLAAFRSELAALPPKSHWPEQPAAAASGSAAAKVVPFPRGWAAWAGLAAAAVVLLSSGWWLVSGIHPRASPQPLWADADLTRLPDDLRRAVVRAAETGTVEAPKLPLELRPPTGTLAGAPAAATDWRQLGPVGAVVREDRPTLRWTAREGATGYCVYLADNEGRAPLLRQELPGETTAWTPSRPLERGAIFEWQVAALSGNKVIERTPRPPQPEARFRVLDEHWNAELTDLEHHYARNPLILGIAYARAGLEEAAKQQFVELARRHPDSKVADRLEKATEAATLSRQ